MKSKKSKLLLCCFLVSSIIISNNVMMASAAKKATIKETEITITNGEQKQIEIVSKKKGAKYSYKSNDTTKATVDNNGLVTAKEAGTAEVVVSETMKKTTKKIATVKVTVKAKEVAPTATPTPTPTPTPAPTSKGKDIKAYLDDTNYDVPNDFWNRKAGVPAGTWKDIKYDSTATNSTRKAKVLLPAGYTTDKKYPVVYFVHGIGGDETSLYNDKVGYIVDNAIAAGTAEPMILVLPNACANADGKCPPKGPDGQDKFFSLEHYAAYDNFLKDFKDCLMPYINQNFSTATGRENTAICGFSMGGRVALHLGFSLPDQIRYIGGFCPAFGILEYSNNNVHENGLFTPQTFTLPSAYMNDTLVLIQAGVNDGVVRDEPMKYHNALTANGVPHIYNLTKGGIDNKGDGGHSGDVFKTGFYNFIRRIFHK